MTLCSHLLIYVIAKLFFKTFSPFSAVIVFAVVGIVMFVVSIFTKKIPRDQLGGLTWSTIDEPPLAQSPKDINIHLAEVGNESPGNILNENTKGTVFSISGDGSCF